MPVFTFTGKTATGEKVSGDRNATTKQDLQNQLRRERITASAIKEKGKECWSSAGSVPGNSGCQPGKYDLPKMFDGCPDDGGRRFYAGQCHARVSQDFR